MAWMKTLIFMGSQRKHGDTMSLVNLLCKDLQGEVKIVYVYDCDFTGFIDCRHIFVADFLEKMCRSIGDKDYVD